VANSLQSMSSSHEKDSSIVYWVHGDCMIIAWCLHDCRNCRGWRLWIDMCMENLQTIWWTCSPLARQQSYIQIGAENFKNRILVNPSSTGCSTGWNYEL